MMEQSHYRVLIVSLSEKFNSEIGSLMQESFSADKVDCVSSAGGARRRLLENTYDFIIVNAPLRDEFGSRLCMDASVSSGTVAAMFTATEVHEEIVHKVTPHGVFVIRKPAAKQTVAQSFSLLVSARERLRAVEKKAGKAESKLDEIKVVNRAKWLLIDNEDMSEAQAHKHIEKAAMDSGITKKQAAQIIIENYS